MIFELLIAAEDGIIHIGHGQIPPKSFSVNPSVTPLVKNKFYLLPWVELVFFCAMRYYLYRVVLHLCRLHTTIEIVVYERQRTA